MPVRRGVEVTGYTPDDSGVDVRLGDGGSLRTTYLVGADGGRSVIRKQAGIDFVGPEATRSHLIAEVQVREEPPAGLRLDDIGVHAVNRAAGRAHRRGRGDRAARSARPPTRRWRTSARR